MTIAHLIRAMGRGPSKGRNLTGDEAEFALRAILKEEATPEAIGALFMLMRYRGETAEEITGFVRAMREDCRGWSELPVSIDWPSYAAGKSRGLPWFLMAAKLLAEDGIDCGVISMHTLRPFDQEAVIKAAQNSKAIITIEEHSIYGGLGSLCASLLMDQGISIPFKIVGIPDEYTITGSQQEIFEHYGISPDGLASAGKKLLNK
jgi:hypothetical protein